MPIFWATLYLGLHLRMHTGMSIMAYCTVDIVLYASVYFIFSSVDLNVKEYTLI